MQGVLSSLGERRWYVPGVAGGRERQNAGSGKRRGVRIRCFCIPSLGRKKTRTAPPAGDLSSLDEGEVGGEGLGFSFALEVRGEMNGRCYTKKPDTKEYKRNKANLKLLACGES